MAIAEKQLGQVVATTTATELLSPGSGEIWVVKYWVAVNHSGGAATVTFYHDADGTTYDTTTVISSNMNIVANGQIDSQVYWPLNGAASSLAVKASVATSITVTMWGAVLS